MMSEYSHSSICGGSFIGIGNVCPGCEDALSLEPLEIRPIELKTMRNSADEAAMSHAAWRDLNLGIKAVKEDATNIEQRIVNRDALTAMMLAEDA